MDAGGGITLFDGLKDEPYGLLPLQNLVAKGGPSTLKGYERVASYSWYMNDDKKATIVCPGAPRSFQFWQGGQLHVDQGILVYDVNHLKLPAAPLDSLILAAKTTGEKQEKPINFQEFDFITDAVNLQKMFAFCRGEGEGLFRIDFERVGNSILMTRVENSDIVNIDYEAFDQHFKMKCSAAAPESVCDGPFFQISKFTFGAFKFLVRYEVDCVDLGPEASVAPKTPNVPAAPKADADGNAPEAKVYTENEKLFSLNGGGVKKQNDLMLMTTYQAGAGFPAFTWAQLFFTGADKILIGWFKGRNDFSKPAVYNLTDINKLVKPLPYAVLSKVHDCLQKVALFLRQNAEAVSISLVWKGTDALEIYEKKPDAPTAVSPGVRELLLSQKEAAPNATAAPEANPSEQLGELKEDPNED